MPADLIDLTDERAASSVVLDTRRTRPRFFDGKFLTAADLMQEQSYLLTRQADLGRTLGFGVAEGLRVSLATTSASNLPNPAASVTVTQGHGITPTGEIVFLPQDLTVDLTDAAQLQRLSAAFGLTREPQQPFQNLRGLFVFGLRAVEFTANPTAAYPPSVDGNGTLRDGEIIEATALTLVPYDSDVSRADPNLARRRVAREIFLDQKILPLPAGVLPLAMLYLRNGTLEWVDEWLVRREAGSDDRFGFGFAPRALAEAHFFQYQDMLQDAPSASNGQLSAQSFLEIIPPAGPLPKAAINSDDFTQAYFPAGARVELALVPEDELAALMEDSVDLPPIDLSLTPEDQDALAILVLAPVPRADYGNVLQTLNNIPPPPLTNPVPVLLSQQRPIDALLKLNAAFLLRQSISNGTAGTPPPPPANFVDPAWRAALANVQQLWFMRRRNLPDGKGLAGTPLPVAPAPAPDGGPVPIPVIPHPFPGPIPLPNPDIPHIIPGIPHVTPTLGVVLPVRTATATTPTPSTVDEKQLAAALAAENLWARFAVLRAISDVPAHTTLVQTLANGVVMANPVLQHALITALEATLELSAAKPDAEFAALEKNPTAKALTQQMVVAAATRFVNDNIMRGLQSATKDTPRLLTDKSLRAALGLSDRVDALAQIGLKFTRNAGFSALMEAVQKNAAADKPKPIATAIDHFLKKVNS